MLASFAASMTSSSLMDPPGWMIEVIPMEAATSIPSLKGKFEGVAMRVPTPNVSLIELVFCTKKEITKEKVNSSFLKASKAESKGIIDITEEKLVSIDFNHSPFSAILDASLTCVIGKNMGKISAWYDNEWGFSNRMCDLAKYIHKI